MEYAILIILLIISSIFIPLLIIFQIERIKHKKIKKWIKITVTPISSLFLIVFGICAYLGIFYRATSEAYDTLKNSDDVIVYDTKDYYFFDNKDNDDTAIIFYPGAKVEEAAYAPLMKNIAKNDIDVFIIKMPFHFALFGINKADKVLESTSYTNIYLMGHSLGGTAISLYATNSSYSFDGIIFLASYTTKKLNDNMSSLSIYGTNDLVLNKNDYIKNKELLPKNNNETIIEGGNHSYFGNYGNQRRDGSATISREYQQEQATNAIVNYINNNS